MHVCVLTLYIILVFLFIMRVLSKTHQSSLTLKFFLKSTRPSLPLKKGLSKTHQSSLTLKGGSTSHLGLLPSGEKRKPLLLVALNHFILWLADHQRSTPAAELRFFVRDEPHGHTIQDVCCLLDACCLLELLFEGTADKMDGALRNLLILSSYSP